MRLKDKVAIITGAGRGIGRAIALAFAGEGADIVIAEIDFQSAKRVGKEIESIGRKSLAVKTDVSFSKDVNQMVGQTIDEFGKIDILINNSAIYPMGPFLEETEEEIDRVFAVNLKGAFLCTQAVAKQMVRQKKGKIISISSGQGRIGVALQAHYSATKGGIISATRAWAAELSPLGIHVNAICPGITLTENVKDLIPRDMKEAVKEQTPMRRLGVAEDYVGITIFLASSESDFITGQIISVDGGLISP